MIVNLTRAIESEAFPQTNEANSLQFSLKAEVLPSNNLEMSRNCQGYVGKKQKNWHHLEVLVSYEYSHALNGFKQVQIAYLAAISYLDKLVQFSFTLST